MYVLLYYDILKLNPALLSVLDKDHGYFNVYDSDWYKI